MKKIMSIVIITFVIVLIFSAFTYAFTMTDIYGKHGREGWIITNRGIGYETFDVYDKYGNRVWHGQTDYPVKPSWMDDMKLDRDWVDR